MSKNKKKNVKKISASSFARLMALFFHNKVSTAAMLISVAISGFLAALGPKVLGNVTNALTGSGSQSGLGSIDWESFWKWVIVVLIIYGLQFVTKFIAVWTSARNSSDVARILRKNMEDKLWKVPLNYYDTNANGDILSRFTNDIDNVVSVMNNTGSDTIFNIVQFIVTLIMMFIVSWQMTLVTIVLIPLSSVIAKKLNVRARPELAKQWKMTGGINAGVDESINGHTIIKSFGQEEAFLEDFKRKNDALYEASYKAIKMTNMIQPLSRMVTNLNYVIVVIWGAFKVIAGSLTIGDLQAFIQYTRSFQTPFFKVFQAYADLNSCLASLDRIYEYLDQAEEVPEREGARRDYKVKGQIEFKDVSFSYVPSKKLIENMNLLVKPGQMVAIVGGTGAGKTTMVNLIERFYEINSGDIILDGNVSIRDITRQNLRANIAMVLQDTWVFKGTIEENLRYGIPEGVTVSDQAFKEACQETFVDSFVSTLPMGYQTEITNDASQLSAGEKQLLTICRAFLARPDILILDEATSSVDTRTEALIQKALDKLREGRTSFVIAHRLSTIKNADIILVMEKGHIVEQGNHKELLEKNGAYAALHNAQFDYCSRGPMITC